MSLLRDAKMDSLKDKHEAQEDELISSVLEAKVVETPLEKVKKVFKKKVD